MNTDRENYFNSRLADYALRIANTTSLQTKVRLEKERDRFQKHIDEEMREGNGSDSWKVEK